MKQKRIICRSHSVLAAGPHYQTYWDDVWLRWKGKPGRRTYYEAPMLASRAHLEGELSTDKAMQQKSPKHDWAIDIVYSEKMLAMLDAAPYVREEGPCPNVYTNAEYIDRAEAERMLRWFLHETHGITNPKFIWKKSDLIVHNVSFAKQPMDQEDIELLKIANYDIDSGEAERLIREEEDRIDAEEAR